MKVFTSVESVDLLLGVWLLVAPAVIGYQWSRPITIAEDLIPGLFLCATSCWLLLMKWRRRDVTWLQSLCGLWLIAGSIALVFGRLPHAALNGIFVGTAVLLLNAAVFVIRPPATQ